MRWWRDICITVLPYEIWVYTHVHGEVNSAVCTQHQAILLCGKPMRSISSEYQSLTPIHSHVVLIRTSHTCTLRILRLHDYTLPYSKLLHEKQDLNTKVHDSINYIPSLTSRLVSKMGMTMRKTIQRMQATSGKEVNKFLLSLLWPKMLSYSNSPVVITRVLMKERPASRKGDRFTSSVESSSYSGQRNQAVHHVKLRLSAFECTCSSTQLYVATIPQECNHL